MKCISCYTLTWMCVLRDISVPILGINYIFGYIYLVIKGSEGGKASYLPDYGLVGDAAERFSTRDAEKFRFLTE